MIATRHNGCFICIRTCTHVGTIRVHGGMQIQLFIRRNRTEIWHGLVTVLYNVIYRYSMIYILRVCRALRKHYNIYWIIIRKMFGEYGSIWTARRWWLSWQTIPVFVHKYTRTNTHICIIYTYITSSCIQRVRRRRM